jgi:hypothetical protein
MPLAIFGASSVKFQALDERRNWNLRSLEIQLTTGLPRIDRENSRATRPASSNIFLRSPRDRGGPSEWLNPVILDP